MKRVETARDKKHIAIADPFASTAVDMSECILSGQGYSLDLEVRHPYRGNKGYSTVIEHRGMGTIIFS